MERYVAAVCDPRAADGMRTLDSLNPSHARTTSRTPEWKVAFDAPGMLVIHPASRNCKSYPLHRQRGVIVGRVFDRQCSDYSQRREVTFDEARSVELMRSAGQQLVDRYWGSYFAVIHDAEASKHHVFRDPTGTMPCFHLKHAGADIFFSHWEDCARLLPVQPAVNRDFLAKWLLFCSISAEDTGIAGVSRVTASERFTLSQGSIRRSRMWDPVAIAAAPRLVQPEEAATALRSTAQTVIDAWASCYQKITHRLSGGLDSSIVAGCLAHSPSSAQVNYLNVWIDAGAGQRRPLSPGLSSAMAEKARALVGDGDERYFARLVADRWNVPLIERSRTPSLDLQRLRLPPPATQPSMYFTVVENEAAELEMIERFGTQAFFSGQAGDSVLLASSQPLPSMDFAYSHGLRRGLWRYIAWSTALSKESVWAVLGKTLRHGWLRRPYTYPLRILDFPTLVAPSIKATIRDQDLLGNFAQLAAMSTLPPGKRDHVEGIASDFSRFVFDAGERAEHIDPLNSQPLWELMLSIPTYTLLDGGISRGLARRAFADVLPAQIRKRQVKGTGGSFYQQVVRNNRNHLREQLADGLLVQQGYLDRVRLLDCLASEEPSLSVAPATLLSYLAAEIWLQQMSVGVSSAVTSAPPLQRAAVV
jgi:asparagine synthase (glutamine-hydrolysing)